MGLEVNGIDLHFGTGYPLRTLLRKIRAHDPGGSFHDFYEGGFEYPPGTVRVTFEPLELQPGWKLPTGCPLPTGGFQLPANMPADYRFEPVIEQPGWKEKFLLICRRWLRRFKLQERILERQLEARQPPAKPVPSAASLDNPGQSEPATADQYVTLDQAAAQVGRSKRTLQKAIGRTKNPLPDPEIQGMGGKANEWLWSTIRPWLETEYNRKLPAEYPRLTPPRR